MYTLHDINMIVFAFFRVGRTSSRTFTRLLYEFVYQAYEAMGNDPQKNHPQCVTYQVLCVINSPGDFVGRIALIAFSAKKSCMKFESLRFLV